MSKQEKKNNIPTSLQIGELVGETRAFEPFDEVLEVGFWIVELERLRLSRGDHMSVDLRDPAPGGRLHVVDQTRYFGSATRGTRNAVVSPLSPLITR